VDAQLILATGSGRTAPAAPSSAEQWLFAYGSLVADGPPLATRTPHPDGMVADLRGYRRVWGVAMDNTVDIPGYKYYVDPSSGRRPDVRVAFLDITPDPTCAVNGICRPITARELADIDVRERQYVRIEVSDAISSIDATVWTYAGSAFGRSNRRDGDRTDRTVVAREYLDAVVDAFARLGDREHAAFVASTADCNCPVIPLARCEVPAAP
jgi:hypothetical protein